MFFSASLYFIVEYLILFYRQTSGGGVEAAYLPEMCVEDERLARIPPKLNFVILEC